MESPCINVCTVDPGTSRCLGCGRTLAQIAAWTSLSPLERRRIMSELAQFRADRAAVPAGGSR